MSSQVPIKPTERRAQNRSVITANHDVTRRNSETVLHYFDTLLQQISVRLKDVLKATVCQDRQKILAILQDFLS